MDFFSVIDNRISVRRFESSAAIPKDAVERILETARLAPSAGDLQAYRVAVVEREDRKAALATAAHGQDFIAEAALVLAFFADPERSAAKYGKRGSALFAVQDATLASCYAQLAATALGLASCWVGAFSDKGVTEALAAPAALRPVALLAIGPRAERPMRPPRRALADLVCRETFAV